MGYSPSLFMEINRDLNILLIISDQHRGDCLGVYGDPNVKSPHLDALAQDGVTFSNCFTPFPVCTPARYSLLTGLYAHQHLGVTNRSTLPQGLPTFPKILKNHGFRTKCVGKMHFTPTYLDVGFDEMILAEQDGPGRLDDDYHDYLRQKNLIDALDLEDQDARYRKQAPSGYNSSFGTEPTNLDEKDYSTTWIGEKACETLESWDGGGNLLEVGFIKPHHPHDAPERWADLYDLAEIQILPGWTEEMPEIDAKFSKGFFDFSKLTEKTLKQMMVQYYAAISQIDFQVGRMIRILKERGLYDNTLIIYTSDHGDYMGFHHLGLKGNYMYDPLVKIPLIIKYPNNVDAGCVNPYLVSLIDVTATIIDIAGATVPMNLWKIAEPLDAETSKDLVYAETDRGQYMVRTEKYKLLYSDKMRSQFFDLENDPLELANLIDSPEYKDIIKEFKDHLLKWFTDIARPHPNIDHNAPISPCTNAKKSDAGHRQLMEAYFEKKMEEFYKTDKRP